jgi:molybdopterin adenylyltransferase
MPGGWIDTEREFTALGIAILTISDRGLFDREFERFIYVLPGSNGACRDGWDKLISLQIDSRHRPCSIVELLGHK